MRSNGRSNASPRDPGPHPRKPEASFGIPQRECHSEALGLMKLDDELRAADHFIAEYRRLFSVDGSYAPIVEGFELPTMPPGRDGLLGLSRLDALQRISVLMRLLRAEVTTSHYEVWRFCAMYADRR